MPSLASKIGMERVTSRRVSWLSKVTARGVASVRVSDSVFRKERTALTPSVFRKAVEGENPLAVLSPKPAAAGFSVVIVLPRELPLVVVTLGPVRPLGVVDGVEELEAVVELIVNGVGAPGSPPVLPLPI